MTVFWCLQMKGGHSPGVVPGLTPGAPVPAHNLYHLVMGDAMAAITQAGNRNGAEGRMVTVQAVCDRP